MPKLTIKDIAQMAGVSPSAVSIVLNGRSGVSEATREKVMQIIQKTNYVPNPNSRRLLFNQSDNIAVMCNRDRQDLSNQFYVELINEIVPECDNAGFNLIYAFYSMNPNGEIVFPQIIERRDASGVIFLGNPPEPVLQKLIFFEMPFVISDAHESHPGIPSVYTDYRSAAYLATSYLIQAGHRDIGYLGFESPQYMQRTLEGFQFALRDGGCLYHPEWTLSTPNSDEIAFERSKFWGHTDKLPSAIFCTGDFIAIGCLNYFQQKGLRIPGDISIIGIDDILLSRYVSPPLTTVHIDRHEIARSSISLLIDRITGQNRLPENILVPASAIQVRGSVCHLDTTEGMD